MTAATRRGWLAGVAGATVLVALGLLVLGPARADDTQVTVNDRAEAWYASAPVVDCSSPVGCPPVAPPSAYPAGTLHVGEAAGSETARTYLALDTSTLPAGSSVDSGVLTLPVSSDQNAGNVDVASATPVLCLAAASFPNGANGSTDTPPGIDCSVHVAATYQAPSGTTTAGTFTADLRPFFDAWRHGTPDFGIALVPATGESPGGAWHVALNGRQLSDAPHISAVLTVSMPATAATSSGGAPAAPAVTRPTTPTVSVAPPTAVSGPAAGSAVAPVLAAPATSGPARTGYPADTAFSALPTRPVPGPFLWFPLIVLLGGVYAVRTFLRPVLGDGGHLDRG